MLNYEKIQNQVFVSLAAKLKDSMFRCKVIEPKEMQVSRGEEEGVVGGFC